MIWVFIVIAVSTSFWAGYMRRATKFHEAINQGTTRASNDGGSIEFIGHDDGRVIVDVTFKSPIIIDNIEIRRNGRWIVPADQVENLIRVLREQLARSNANSGVAR